MTMKIQFVFILATAIAIHGEITETPREATLAVKNNFEDGLSKREFRVDYPGLDGVQSADIIISRVGDKDTDTPRVKHTIVKGVEKATILYFELNDTEAPEGSYQVKVCAAGKCSAKREAFGKISDEVKNSKLSCIKGKGKEENIYHTFEDKTSSEEFTVEIKGGESFVTAKDFDALPEPVKKRFAFSEFRKSPAYKIGDDKRKSIFYAAVNYNGKNLKELFDTVYTDSEIVKLMKQYSITPKTPTDIHAHEYCKRKYIFWASARVMVKGTNVVKRRFRGTIIVSDFLAVSYILNPNANSFPVEFVRYDDEPLESGTYEVSVSFCASDKDVLDSSVCSKAISSDLII